MNAEKFVEVIKQLRQNQMTVSEYLNKCFDEAMREGIHPDWFKSLQVSIEIELEIFADDNIIPKDILLSENNVEKTEYGLKVTFRNEPVLDIFFPSEFHENIVLRRF